MNTWIKCILFFLALVGIFACASTQKTYPQDSAQLKYVGRNSPGAEVSLDRVLLPDKINILYFYTDG